MHAIAQVKLAFPCTEKRMILDLNKLDVEFFVITGIATQGMLSNVGTYNLLMIGVNKDTRLHGWSLTLSVSLQFDGATGSARHPARCTGAFKHNKHPLHLMWINRKRAYPCRRFAGIKSGVSPKSRNLR